MVEVFGSTISRTSVWIILGLLTVLALLIIRKRIKRAAQHRSARAGRNGLNRNGGRNARPRPSKAAPLALVVFLILGGWLAAAYIAPSDPAPREAAAGPPAEQPQTIVKVQSGKLAPAVEPPITQEVQAAEASPMPPPSGLEERRAAEAADSAKNQMPAEADEAPMLDSAINMAPEISRLEQVGLMLGSSQGLERPQAVPPPPKPEPAPTPKPALATTPAATSGLEPRAGILSGSRGFTVHLGSFNDSENAQKYQNQLNQAGVEAFISEIDVDGRLWHRVMSGHFSTQSEAEVHGRELKRRGLTADTGRYLIKPIN